MILFQDAFLCIMNIILKCFETKSSPSPMLIKESPCLVRARILSYSIVSEYRVFPVTGHPVSVSVRR